MTITITAFERSPDGGKGLARDTRVRDARFILHPLFKYLETLRSDFRDQPDTGGLCA